MRISHEDGFGPVTAIIKVKDHNEALDIANNTSYGLSSGVITNDMQEALDFAFKLEAGMVHINDCTVADQPHVPFGGVENSGFGREGGRFSMEEMTEVNGSRYNVANGGSQSKSRPPLPPRVARAGVETIPAGGC
jgi:vanillin dehydrogenase